MPTPPRIHLAPLLPFLLATACGGEASTPPPAEYVGAAACAECHAAEVDAWRSSQHALAMLPPDSASVRADFNGTRFVKDGVVTSFRHEGGRYLVTTDGPDGRPTEYEVAWTFGVDPLQQYLLPTGGGRVQALGVAWDTRPASEGGQRWFHLYGDERVPAGDELHWTGPMQNWNFMCADCHSTDVQKGWTAAADSFATAFAEVNVACEACHGPASRHVEWAGTPDAQSDSTLGLVNPLHPTPAGTWSMPAGGSIARRAISLDPADRELDTCAFCHSRRGRTWEAHTPGDPIGQWGRLAILDEGLYEADGTQLDEVYKVGSFLHSRMHAAGVRCSDCHDPHTGKPRAEGNAICAQCHLPATYDVEQHTRHPAGSTGASCAACHMPTRTYMGVDQRHDHGFRVPRPDRSARIGAPDACTDCHADRSQDWAAGAIREWHGAPDSTPGWPEALYRGRQGAPGAARLLLDAARAESLPGIVRATAISLLPRNPDPRSQGVLEEALRSPDPLIRRTGLEAMAGTDPGWRLLHASPLLDDQVRDVRLAAVTLLAGIPAEVWPETARAMFERAAEELRASLRYNGDRAEALTALGGLEARMGNLPAADTAYRAALRRWDEWEPAWVGLADLYRATGREPQADSVLRAGLARLPESAALHHSLGLSLVRQGLRREALAELSRAAELAPEQPRFAFVHAVALHDAGDRAQAMAVLEAALDRHPYNRDLLGARAAWEAP